MPHHATERTSHKAVGCCPAARGCPRLRAPAACGATPSTAGAPGGTRTPTSSRTTDFESAASTVPPLGLSRVNRWCVSAPYSPSLDDRRGYVSLMRAVFAHASRVVLCHG